MTERATKRSAGEVRARMKEQAQNRLATAYAGVPLRRRRPARLRQPPGRGPGGVARPGGADWLLRG